MARWQGRISTKDVALCQRQVPTPKAYKFVPPVEPPEPVRSVGRILYTAWKPVKPMVKHKGP